MTKKQQENIIGMFVAAAEKFVNKVDTGIARSIETYADLKACLKAIKHEETNLDKPLTRLQLVILFKFKVLGPMTDRALVGDFTGRSGLSASSIRTRRAELVALGKVRNSLRTEPTLSGRMAIVWEATPSWVMPAKGPYIQGGGGYQ